LVNNGIDLIKLSQKLISERIGADSLDVVELVMAIEDEFEMEMKIRLRVKSLLFRTF
jgi:acyl carrier protein